MTFVELVRHYYNYNPVTGEITVRVRVKRSRKKIGEPIGFIDNMGYVRMQLPNKKYERGHRIAWAIYYGEEPPTIIDHINEIRNDNRIDNLRAATKGDNMRNISVRSANKSGYRGVHRHSTADSWIAQIGVNGKRVHLGSFRTPEDASAAYEAALAQSFA